MTDTSTLAPTDEEIIAWAMSHQTDAIKTLRASGFVRIARAVLAKWGVRAPVSEPYAYEFSRSNGDGTHSVHIERGSLQEVVPGRWEHVGPPKDALVDTSIKALYTTPQTQPAAAPAGTVEHDSTPLPARMEPVAWRVRYRSEPGMLGHYPWTYTDRKPRRPNDATNEVEPVYAASQVQAMLAAAPSGPARVPLLARALAEWHEEDGYAAWWAITNCGWASEPAWIGTPLSSDWPGYHTHWTPHPEIPCDPSITAAPNGGKHG